MRQKVQRGRKQQHLKLESQVGRIREKVKKLQRTLQENPHSRGGKFRDGE
jgi:hypothetical protein